MSTSVTKKTAIKGSIIYLAISIFCVIFTYVYELYSYGESSPYMRLMFLAPLISAAFFVLTAFGFTWLQNRASLLVFNSGIAIIVSACLVKGIIEVSGRTTTIDQPYWYVAIAFLVLSLILGLFKKNRKAAV
ncbi:hypothetical protein [Streptococcus loxodontisalivarius]|uniref:Magnesium-transporting ATPase (P-type) n=1 Tax=Streptococcus loxodontisalivarius TaxID=1349415 RepID=A0ABS2PQ55_9STRE|nr:hypothetical protein [Streptococcus loxodontisalivarius]MBM7642006.1 magnesium-transporting ATPase (P-type) [Streptococcus loxodontisalivarius]